MSANKHVPKEMQKYVVVLTMPAKRCALFGGE